MCITKHIEQMDLIGPGFNADLHEEAPETNAGISN